MLVGVRIALFPYPQHSTKDLLCRHDIYASRLSSRSDQSSNVRVYVSVLCLIKVSLRRSVAGSSSSAMDIIRDVWKTQGMRGFYRYSDKARKYLSSH